MKLKPKQREALEWLSKQPWRAAWWGGKPHGRWPKEMSPQTYYSLSHKKLVETRAGEWADQIVSISDAGKAALSGGERT
jgi:hypothetical protein